MKLLLITIILKVAIIYSFPLCTVPNVPKDLLVENSVSVVYLTDTSCIKCKKELKRLSDLFNTFLNAGINLNIIVSESNGLPQSSSLPENLKLDNGDMWTALDGEIGHIYIFDRCGRLTYEVIQPWVSLKYPFVKAAILSAIYDQPCGECTPKLLKSKYDVETEEDKSQEIKEYPPLTERNYWPPTLEPDENGHIPMHIAFYKPHKHKGDDKLYKVIELLTGHPEFHGHGESDEDIFNSVPDSAPNKGNMPPDLRQSKSNNLKYTETIEISDVDKTYEKPKNLQALSSFRDYNYRDEIQNPSLNDYAQNDKMQYDTSECDNKNGYELGGENPRDEYNQLLLHYNNVLKWVNYNI